MKGDAEAMLMLSECYSAASGLEKDEHMSSEWLERAAELRCPGALYKKAMRILRDLEFSPDKVRKLLCNFDDTYESGFGDTTPGSEVDQLSSPSRSSRGRAMSACPLMRSRTEGQLHGNSSDSHRNRDRSTEREIEMNMRSSQVRQSRETMIDRDEEDEENFQHAMQLLRESAERGFVAAKTDLGNMFELAADEESAFRWFEVASSVGCPKAMNKLGLLYFHGKGTAQDLERAFSLFTSAAKAGDKDANNNAGSCLEQGLGTEMRHAAALTYYLKGAEMDSTPAMYSLGYLLIRSSVKSLEDLKVAREMHSAHSLTHTDEWDRHGRYASRDRFNGRHSMDADQGLEGTAKTRLGSSMAGVSASYAGIASVDIFSSSREQEKKGKKPPRPLSVPHNSNTFNNTQRSTTSQRNNSSNSRPVSLSKSASHTLSLSLANAPRLNDTYSSAQTAIDSLESQQEKAEAQVKEGVRWLRAAAEKGMMDARYQLGLVYQQVRVAV
jgi:TPR repeat protein